MAARKGALNCFINSIVLQIHLILFTLISTSFGNSFKQTMIILSNQRFTTRLTVSIFQCSQLIVVLNEREKLVYLQDINKSLIFLLK